MTYAQMSLQMMQVVLIEYLGNKAQTFVDVGGLAVACCDSGGLLTSMLQGVNGEIGQPSDIQPGRTDAKDAACFAGRV
jgi:hypothetical protein